jgi:hypothetical protein
MSRVRSSPWPLFFVLALCGPQPLQGTDPESARSALKGINAFRVVVEQFGSKVERHAALNREELQADVEQMLAQAGIPVSKDAPDILHANVAVVCGPEDCAFHVALQVQQKVRLESRPRDRTLVATTWSTGGTGLVARRSDLIRRNLREQVDQFVTAYRAANPAKQRTLFSLDTAFFPP